MNKQNNIPEIVLVGGGGHAKVVIDTIHKNGDYKIKGIIEKSADVSGLFNYPVLGNDDKLNEVYAAGCKNAFIAIGSIGDPSHRVKLYEKLKQIGFALPVIVHPAAVIAEGAVIEEGSFIAAGAVIGPDAKIGKNVIINTNTSVDHDCIIGDHIHMAPGVTLSAGVEIGHHAHIGTGSSVIQYRKIGAGTLIGAGSIVVKDIPEKVKAYGNPCRVMGDHNV
ncbi:MAG: acetyltransferase [Candidatus Margulisiibacteriota bacterium]